MIENRQTVWTSALHPWSGAFACLLLAVVLLLTTTGRAQAATLIPRPTGFTALARETIVGVAPGYRTLTAGPSTGSVTLAWDKSPDTNAVGYRVYLGVGSSRYTNSYTVGNVTNVTLTGLSIGVRYYFGATAYDASGVESDFSNETSYLIPWAAPVLSIRPYTYLVEGTTVPNRTNRVQKSTNLTNWSTVMLFVGGTNGVWGLIVTNNQPQAYYRVKVE